MERALQWIALIPLSVAPRIPRDVARTRARALMMAGLLSRQGRRADFWHAARLTGLVTE